MLARAACQMGEVQQECKRSTLVMSLRLHALLHILALLQVKQSTHGLPRYQLQCTHTDCLSVMTSVIVITIIVVAVFSIPVILLLLLLLLLVSPTHKPSAALSHPTMSGSPQCRASAIVPTKLQLALRPNQDAYTLSLLYLSTHCHRPQKLAHRE